MRHKLLLILSLLITVPPLHAQTDALNLPTTLYVLLNTGVVERYGTGDDGVTTVTSEDQFVIDFGVAPDGNWLAYRTEEALILTDPITGSGSLLEMNPGIPPLRGNGSTIAWSPIGDAIAYTTETGLSIYFRGESADDEPVTITVSAGMLAELSWSPGGGYLAARSAEGDWLVYRVTNRTATLASVVPDALGFAWNGPASLLFGPIDGGLRSMDLSEANAQEVVLGAGATYDALTVLSDETILGFSRAVGQNDLVDETAGLYTEIPLENRSATVLGETPLALDSLRWAPGGNLAVVFEGGAIALVNPVSGSGFTLPINNAVMYAWGPVPLPRVTGLALPRNVFFVADDEGGTAQVWQMVTNGTDPFLLTTADADVTGYAVATNGLSLAYSSEGVLWLQRFDGSDPVQLTDLETSGNAMPAFDPTSSRVAYVDGGIRVVSILSGDSQLVAPDILSDEASLDNRVLFNPRFAPNLDAVLVSVGYYEGGSTGILDMTSGELQELPFGFSNAQWLPDGRVLTFGPSGPYATAGVQITTVAAPGDPLEVLPETVSIVDAVPLADNALRLITNRGFQDGPNELRVFDFRPAAGLLPVTARGFISQPQLSPDGSFVLGYTRILETDTQGYASGPLTFFNVETGEQVVLEAPGVVSLARWQT